MGARDTLVQFVGITLLGWLAILLWRRNIRREFPFFFLFVVTSIVITIARMGAVGNYLWYFRIFWGTEAIYAVLSLVVLHEAFHSVFLMDYEGWPWFRLVFPSAVALLCIIFVGHAVLHPPIEATLIIAVIISFEKVVNCVKGGLFVLFTVLAFLLLGKSWPTYPFGVVVGFAVSALGAGTAYWVRSVFGTHFNLLGKYAPPVAYILAVLIWILSCFLPSEPESRRTGGMKPEEALATIKGYIQALKGHREKMIDD
jgi:hypothetical protein